MKYAATRIALTVILSCFSAGLRLAAATRKLRDHRHRHGHFAFYAHFQPNTLKVHKGDKVRRGQVLALLGNSGNSDAPHLHFGIEDGPLPFVSNGVPFVFSSFTTTGAVTNSFDDIAAGATAQIGPARAGPHRNELPLNDDVITFPKQ